MPGGALQQAAGDVREEAREVQSRVIEYLYDPADVADLLTDMPVLADVLSRMRSSDRPSAAYGRLMKSSREVYRLLTNVRGYPALGAVLESLDACMAAGWTEPKLVKTRSQPDFESHIAAVAVAEALRRQRYRLSNPDADAAFRGDSRPDIIATREGAELCPLSVSYTHLTLPTNREV